jgi:hypothetical protein
VLFGDRLGAIRFFLGRSPGIAQWEVAVKNPMPQWKSAAQKLDSANAYMLHISGPVPRVEGENGKSVMARLPRIHIDEFLPEEKGKSVYKIISLFAIRLSISRKGEYAQFGVFKGATARFFLPYVPGNRKFHLFDSFTGLPHEWGGKLKAGAFDLKGQVPNLNTKRCVIHKGWFKDTVPGFAASAKTPMAFLHLDADLYSSTMEVLRPLNSRIVPGSILLFDEYMLEGQDEEHRALVDWAKSENRDYEYLWRTRWSQVAVRVLR